MTLHLTLRHRGTPPRIESGLCAGLVGRRDWTGDARSGCDSVDFIWRPLLKEGSRILRTWPHHPLRRKHHTHLAFPVAVSAEEGLGGRGGEEERGMGDLGSLGCYHGHHQRGNFAHKSVSYPFFAPSKPSSPKGGFVYGMEMWARWAHRDLWHASLWNLHESHHIPREGPFEKNDIFAITNSIPVRVWGVDGSCHVKPDFAYYCAANERRPRGSKTYMAAHLFFSRSHICARSAGDCAHRVRLL